MNLAPLLYWVSEREKIRKAKEAGLPSPWSQDPIFQTYRFTNIRRKDDRASRWLRQHVLTEENLMVDTRQFIMFAAFCRWCNWPPTIAEIMRRELFPSPRIKWDEIIKVFTEFKAEKRKCWTGAFMVTARGCAEGESKADFIVERVVHQGMNLVLLEIEKALRTHQRREVWLVLKSINSFGHFMSAQIVDDFGWTSLLSDAADIFTWASTGPGSIKGYNRLLGRPLSSRVKEEVWCAQLQTWRNEIIHELGKEYEDLTLHDLQNCLCEYSKYSRTQLGEGRPRSRYRPETKF